MREPNKRETPRGGKPIDFSFFRTPPDPSFDLTLFPSSDSHSTQLNTAPSASSSPSRSPPASPPPRELCSRPRSRPRPRSRRRSRTSSSRSLPAASCSSRSSWPSRPFRASTRSLAASRERERERGRGRDVESDSLNYQRNVFRVGETNR